MSLKFAQVYPEIADAAQNNPTRFRELLPQISRLSNAAKEEEERNRRLLMSDPFDVGAQKQIEENIRRQAVLENMEHAMEYSPESFGRVVMLYVNVEINGHPVKAFVDSGAQATISAYLLLYMEATSVEGAHSESWLCASLRVRCRFASIDQQRN